MDNERHAVTKEQSLSVKTARLVGTRSDGTYTGEIVLSLRVRGGEELNEISEWLNRRPPLTGSLQEQIMDAARARIKELEEKEASYKLQVEMLSLKVADLTDRLSRAVFI